MYYSQNKLLDHLFKTPLLFLILKILSFVYITIIKIRLLAYKNKLLKSFSAPCKVISIGNITCGGSGKSPFVIFLSKLISNQKILILSRGYGRSKNTNKDDEDISHLNLDHVTRIANKKRALMAKSYIKNNPTDLIILDDGFQHLQIKRDVDILLIDALSPFSNDHVLPAGLLREPHSHIKRASIIILSKSNQVAPSKIILLQKKIKKIHPKCKILLSQHSFSHFTNLKDKQLIKDKNFFQAHKVFAFCGIGNPESFFQTLNDLNIHPIKSKTYADHHPFNENDIKKINHLSQEADYILCTEKDAIKLKPFLFHKPIYTVNISLTMNKDCLQKFIKYLKQLNIDITHP